MSIHPYVTRQAEGMGGVCWEAQWIQQKQLPGSRGETCPQSLPVHRDFCQAREALGVGKLEMLSLSFPYQSLLLLFLLKDNRRHPQVASSAVRALPLGH